MKNLLALSFSVLVLNYCSAQGNALDKSFGDKGKVATAIKYGSYDEIHSVVCQSDGKIVAAGIFGSGTPGNRAAIVRYNKDGSEDQNFGTAGKVQMGYPGLGVSATGLVGIQKISGAEYFILADRQFDITTSAFSLLMARYKPDGTLDNTFGTTGMTRLSDIYPTRIAIDPNNKIIVTATPDSAGNFDIFRFLPNGQPDNTFGINGHTLRQDTFSGYSKAVILQNDGKILVGGQTDMWPTMPNGSMAVVRYMADGSIDNTFGVNGFAALTDTNISGQVMDIALQSDGKILICGTSDTGTGERFYLTRLMQNGSVDAGFGYGGAIFTDFGTGTQAWANAVLVQGDDKIYVAGYASKVDYTFAIARYSKNGIVDSTFGVNGRDTTNVGERSLGLAGTITSNKSVIMAGYSNYQRPTELTHDFALLKYLSGLELGIIDLAFANKPVVYPNPASSLINISYEIEKENVVSIQLADITGSIVQRFKKNEKQRAGKYNEALYLNGSVPAGTYFLQIVGTEGSYSVQLVVVK